MSALKTLQQQIDISTKLKICGYIREYEQNNNKDKIIIPIMIQYIIMLYYLINDKFSKHGNSLQLHKNSKIVSVKSNENRGSQSFFNPQFNVVYGNITTDDQSISKYKWSIRYSINTNPKNSFEPFNYFSVGIASNDYIKEERLEYQTYFRPPSSSRSFVDTIGESIFYCVNIKTGKVHNNYNGDHTSDSGCDYFNNKGIIHLLLDVEKKRLSFSLNTNSKQYNIDQNVAFDFITYRLAISMYLKEGNECELINFETSHKQIRT